MALGRTGWRRGAVDGDNKLNLLAVRRQGELTTHGSRLMHGGLGDDCPQEGSWAPLAELVYRELCDCCHAGVLRRRVRTDTFFPAQLPFPSFFEFLRQGVFVIARLCL